MEVLLGAVNYKGTSNRKCREYDDGSNALHFMITIGFFKYSIHIF